MRIISQRQRVEVVNYFMEWDLPDSSVVGKVQGYSFESDKNGHIIMDELAPEGLANLRKCQVSGVLSTVDRFVSHYWQGTVIKCDCGRVSELYDAMTNHCDCGRWYNGQGQQLSHPSQWGEETGERFNDAGQYVGGGDD
jgi:hypothetical protein